MPAMPAGHEADGEGDLRGITRLAESRLPCDVVFLLDRSFSARGRAAGIWCRGV